MMMKLSEGERERSEAQKEGDDEKISFIFVNKIWSRSYDIQEIQFCLK